MLVAVFSLFGDITVRDSVPGHSRPVALFGDIEIDLGTAALPQGGLTITAVAPFGDIDIFLPDGVKADVGGFTLFGSKRVAVPEPVPAGDPAPVVRLRGYSVFGSFKVRGRSR
jgi:Cell wall-active antibiotics response LiaF, C-terminal